MTEKTREAVDYAEGRRLWSLVAALRKEGPVEARSESYNQILAGEYTPRYNHSKHNNACLDKAGDDEPIFVIRAQDQSAPAVVRAWIAANPHMSPEKRAEAEDCLLAMCGWPKKKKAD